MEPIEAAIKDLEMIGDCRTCGNKTPFCESNPDSCSGYTWRGTPPMNEKKEKDLLDESDFRKMMGEPVWLSGEGLNKWEIISDIAIHKVVCFSRMSLPLSEYNKSWKAYRHKQ